MRCVLIAALICAGFLIAVPTKFSASAAVSVSAAVQVNFSDLDEYGEWVHTPDYGSVWRPYAEADWKPFMYGRWVYSNDGWVWDADEPFGWIVCHYGSWVHNDDDGWLWVPGYEWSPARVHWRVTDREVGWSPIFAGRYGRSSVDISSSWFFCPTPLFTSVEVRRHIEVRQAPRASVSVSFGTVAPRIEVVERFVRAPVVRVSVNKVSVTRERPLVRVEVRRPTSEVRYTAPVGVQYKRVEVRRAEPENSRVIVTPSVRANVTIRSQRDEDPDVTVRTRREEPAGVTVRKVESEPSRKVKVEVRGKSDDDQDDEDDNHKKTRIEVRKN